MFGQHQPAPNPLSDLALPGSAGELARQVMQKELAAGHDSERFEYRDRRQTPEGSITKEVVETDEGPIGRVIAVNDSPLNAGQQQKEEKKLRRLMNDSGALSRRQKSQREDEARTRRMLAALPTAFLYDYDGAEDSPLGTLVRLRFRPNPAFDPPNRETQVYRGMQGTMLIEPHDRRLVEMKADLFKQVNFGWGIFGRLDPGGHFLVRQSRLSPTRWDTTEMVLQFTGRILLFKRLKIDAHEVESGFQPVSQRLTLKQGVELLDRQAPELAQSIGSSKAAQRTR